MLHSIRTKVISLGAKDGQRSERIVQNIIMSFGVKGGSILVGLILVPMTINYISPIEYGIWLTISSIVSWISFFDIGLGNGLRNKLAHALAFKKYEEAKIYISTTYAILTIISILLLLFFIIINPWLDWLSFLNIPDSVSVDIQLVMLIAVGSFCIQFVMQLINTILIANQEPAIAGLILFIGQLAVILSVFLLKLFIPGSLEILILVLTLNPIIVLAAASLILFQSKFRHISPSLYKIDFSYSKSLLNIGGAFFIIQIGALALFQTNNIILTKVIGPTAVTEFNVVYKLFSVVTMIFTIIVTPYWSAFTDAYAKADYVWMRASVHKIRKFWIGLSILIIPLLYFFSETIFRLWIGNSLVIPNILSLCMAFYTIAYSGLMLNCYFLNGIGKIKIQLYLYIISCIINVPLGIAATKMYGASGVVLSNALIITAMNIILWIQCDKIISRKETGLWGK